VNINNTKMPLPKKKAKVVKKKANKKALKFINSSKRQKLLINFIFKRNIIFELFFLIFFL